MNYKNYIEIEIELDNGDLIMYGVEYYYTPGCAKRQYGHPDDWSPAEGPEIDIIKVAYEQPLNKEQLAKFLDQHEEYVIDQIVKQEETIYEP